VIDLSKLPKEIRDTIELKEAVDQTFSRFCIAAEEPIFVNGSMSKMKNIFVGDRVVGIDGLSNRIVNKVWRSNQECLKIYTDCAGTITVSKKHIMVLKSQKLLFASELIVGNVLMVINDGREYPKIISIEEAGMKDCIDIEIDGNRLFAVANGIITHNCDEDYTEILWNILAERADPGIEHSFIASIYGSQGCHIGGTKIVVKGDLKPIEQVTDRDLVWTRKGWKKCIPIKVGKKTCLKIILGNGSEFIMTLDHKMETTRGWVAAKDLVFGDEFVRGSVQWRSTWNAESEKAALVAMMMADGSLCKVRHSDGRNWHHFSRFVKGDKVLIRLFGKWIKKYAGATKIPASCLVNNTSKFRTIEGQKSVRAITVNKQSVFYWFVRMGIPTGKKSYVTHIPRWVFASDAAMNGFLAGYFACDGSFDNGRQISIGTMSEELSKQLRSWLNSRGMNVRLTKSKSGMNYIRICGNESILMWLKNVKNLSKRKKVVLKKYVSKVYKSVALRSLSKQSKVVDISYVGVHEVFDLHTAAHEYVANGFISHNSGKSFAAIAMCCYLDPNFSVDSLFFDYNELVYERHKLKPNSAVLVDEQSQSFGLDSHRVMVILASLKEQLRKKSIHFLFCSPVLYEEHKSSMYLLETIFIDYETQECYAALKTRDGLTLGHVRIPHPLKVLDDDSTLASKELIDAYQMKKDAHLDRLLNSKNIDVFEQRAEQVMQLPMFKKAEQIYVRKMGYIPQSSLINIINKAYPEYAAGVVPVEIAGRIKLNKELSGQWEVSGYGSKRVLAARQDHKRRK